MKKYFYVTVLIRGKYLPIIGPISRREIAETLVRPAKLFCLKNSSEAAFGSYGVSKFVSEIKIETLAKKHSEDFKKFISVCTSENELRLLKQEGLI